MQSIHVVVSDHDILFIGHDVAPLPFFHCAIVWGKVDVVPQHFWFPSWCVALVPWNFISPPFHTHLMRIVILVDLVEVVVVLFPCNITDHYSDWHLSHFFFLPPWWVVQSVFLPRGYIKSGLFSIPHFVTHVLFFPRILDHTAPTQNRSFFLKIMICQESVRSSNRSRNSNLLELSRPSLHVKTSSCWWWMGTRKNHKRVKYEREHSGRTLEQRVKMIISWEIIVAPSHAGKSTHPSKSNSLWFFTVASSRGRNYLDPFATCCRIISIHILSICLFQHCWFWAGGFL